MRVVGVKRAWGQRSRSFSNSDQLLTDVGCGVVGDALRRPSAAANPQGSARDQHDGGSAFSDQDCRTTMTVSFRALRSVARAHLSTAALMAAEPHIRSPFRERLGTTIPHSRGHRAREGGSTLYVGISQPLFATVRPPGSNGADQALVELAMIPILCLSLRS